MSIRRSNGELLGGGFFGHSCEEAFHDSVSLSLEQGFEL